MQILEIKKFNLQGSILDMGSKKSPLNVTNYIKSNNRITYLDKYSNISKDLKVDLEKEYSDSENIKFNNVILMNVLEHIYNYQNCMNICNFFLKKKGIILGSTPFYFQVHGSPNDYFRYTSEALILILKKSGFYEIEIKVLAGGIFICFFNSISRITQKLLFLNNIIFVTCQLLDFILSLFSKNLKLKFPLGYFFKGKK